MKRIKTRALALLLSCCLCLMYILNGYEDVQAADLSAGALQYGADLSFLEGLFMSAGAGALGLDMLLKTKNDINNWDWGDVLDSPASQGQIDKANDTIEKLYNNAVKDWHEKHGGSSDPTPTPLPDVSPPVTVAPINPDDVEPPEDWGTLKKNSQDKGILAMGAATAYCVKEAVKGWWDNVVHPVNVSSDIPEDIVNEIVSNGYPYYLLAYDKYHNKELYLGSNGSFLTKEGGYFYSGIFIKYWNNGSTDTSKFGSYNGYSFTEDPYINRITNMPEFSTEDEGLAWRKQQLANALPKTSLWPSTDLKDDYDNNRSPNLSELVTPALRLPTLGEIKNLWQQGSDDEDNRPIYVTNFITNHVVQTTPEPEPPDKPDVKPTPTIAVVPDPGGGSGSGGSGSGTNPDNSKPENPEDEVKPYTADLKDVFPFCIPFDLIHLFEVFDAEPEAPVFEIPIELKFDNPFTGSSIVDYEDSIKIDLSDYEQPIKVIRIFEVIFFLIGLMLITRSHMIKG